MDIFKVSCLDSFDFDDSKTLICDHVIVKGIVPAYVVATKSADTDSNKHYQHGQFFVSKSCALENFSLNKKDIESSLTLTEETTLVGNRGRSWQELVDYLS